MKTTVTSVSENPLFIMLIGPPGVGKSTWCKNELPEIIKGDKFARISSDDYIEKAAAEQGKTYTEVFKETIPFAQEQSKLDFMNAIEKGIHVVWDQTNLSSKRRQGVLKQIPNEYVPICVYWVIENEAKWRKQLERPGKTIPENVLLNMLDNYQYPSFNEGWDSIKKVIVK